MCTAAGSQSRQGPSWCPLRSTAPTVTRPRLPGKALAAVWQPAGAGTAGAEPDRGGGWLTLGSERSRDCGDFREGTVELEQMRGCEAFLSRTPEDLEPTCMGTKGI